MAQTERAGLKETIAAEETAVEQAGQRLENVRQQEKDGRSQLDALRAGVREAEAVSHQADGVVSRQRRTLAAVERQARIRELESRCAKAQAAEKRQRKAQQGAAAILVTDEVLEVQYAVRPRGWRLLKAALAPPLPASFLI